MLEAWASKAGCRRTNSLYFAFIPELNSLILNFAKQGLSEAIKRVETSPPDEVHSCGLPPFPALPHPQQQARRQDPDVVLASQGSSPNILT